MSLVSANNMSSLSEIRQRMANDGKVIHSVSVPKFLINIGIFVPVWATTVLPLTITWQVLKKAYDTISPRTKFQPQSPFDTGYVVDAGDIIPRKERKYDIILLGATGFVGKLAVRHLAKTYGSDGKHLRWAIAGRSEERLAKVKSALATELGDTGINNIDTIIADTSVPSTLPNLVRNSKVIVCTTGPFWDYGSAVIEFCSKFGTHYTDITGETSWVKTMMAKWQDKASQTGAKIVPLAGHDSIPWDLSVSILAERLKDIGEDLKEVTCLDEVQQGPSGGTIATLLMGTLGHLPDEPEENPFRKRADGTNQPDNYKAKLSAIPAKIVKPWDFQSAYGSPFLMAIVNQDVVSWSQSLRGGGPLTYTEVSVSPDFKTMFVGYFQLIAFLTGVLNPVTRALLASFVLPKPGDGPSLNTMEKESFLSITTRGVGTKGSVAEAAMYFPRDAGYLDTARMVVESGICMALEEDKLSVEGGGFFSPGFCLGQTLLHRLTKSGTFFYSGIQENKNSER